jgi:hypothetical protein
MRTQLPAGVGVVQSPADSILAGDLFTLPFDVAGTQRKQRDLWLKFPSAASVTTSSTVRYRDSTGAMVPYGSPATATVSVAENESSARAAVQTALGQVGTSNSSDRMKLQRIKDDVTATAQTTNDPRVILNRLRALVDAIGTIERSRWTNTTPAWTALARLVTYVEYDYYSAGDD